MANEKNYIASLSGGKDSVAMVLRLIAEEKPLTHVVFYDSGMEFDAIYEVIRQMQVICSNNGISFVYLKSKVDFLTQMLIQPVSTGKPNEHYGYDWCGGACRWRTSEKIKTINEFISTLNGEIIQYIGIAVDEPKRIKEDVGKVYPLVEWNMTEADCLQYCRDNGIRWLEGDIDLYAPGCLKRVSCWCCKNKNLSELRFYFHHLPKYWNLLKGLQSRIDRPFYCDKTIFELEERFRKEDEEKANEYCQLSLFDLVG